MSEESVILSLKIEEGVAFKKFIDALKDILTQARFEFVRGGMFIRAMDDPRIVYTEVNIPSSGFDNYLCETEDDDDGEVPIQLDLNLAELHKVLNSCGDNETIEIKYSKVETINEESEETEIVGDNKIKIKIAGATGDMPRRSRTFTLALVDLPEGTAMNKRLPLAKLMMFSIDMPDGLLDLIIKDAEIYSDTIVIGCDDEKMNFSASGDLGVYEEPMQDSIVISKITKKVKGKKVAIETSPVSWEYQLSPLKAVLKMSHETSENLNVQMGAKNEGPAPIRINLQILNGGIFDFFLAPKADDSEDDDYE